MEMRKVQLTGGSSITVTLPKAWVDKSRIQAGDIVGCSEQPDGSLTIHPHTKGERSLKHYEFEVVESQPGYLFRKVIAAYLTGYDAIRITSKRPLTAEAKSVIRQAVRRIMGLEIVEEQANSVTVQDFLDPREFHLEKALRRMLVLCQSMQAEAVQVIQSPPADPPRLDDERDDEVDRLYWLINKQYHAILRDSSYAAKMGLNATQALNFLLAARLVERTADHADRIIRQSRQLAKGKIPAAFTERLERQARKAQELFQNSVQTFLRKDALKANDIINEVEKFLPTQDRLLRDATDLGSEAVSHLAFIIESVGRTAAYAADVAEVAVNHKVASEV